MKQLIIIWIFIFFSFFIFAGAENNKEEILDTVIQVLADSEMEEMKNVLDSWIDREEVKYFSQKTLSDEYIKNLYSEFKNTIVNPPKPDKYTEYTIPNAKKSLEEVEKLGKKMQNLFMGMSDKDFKKYGKLIAAMRETLYIDWKHIPYAMKHNNARDLYWYKMHKVGVEGAEKEYIKHFNE